MQHFQNNSISTHFAIEALKSAKRMGIDLSGLLQEAELDPKRLSNPKFRLTPAQFGTLIRLVWERGDDEFMGCAEQPARHGTFSLFAREALRADSLDQVYRHLCRFYRLVNNSLELTYIVGETEASLSMTMRRPALDADHLLRDFLMLLWHRFPSWLIGQRIPLIKVEMQGPKPEHADEYRLIFPCPVTYNAHCNRMIFDRTTLKAPIVQNLEGLKDHLRHAPLQWFTRQEYLPVFTRRVKDYMNIDTLQASDHPNEMNTIAIKLNMTTRTLRRKLNDEGTSFQEIKDEVRRDAAIHKLNQSRATVQAIAQQLGFSETAAFTRAFKRWTGQTPREFRKGVITTV